MERHMVRNDVLYPANVFFFQQFCCRDELIQGSNFGIYYARISNIITMIASRNSFQNRTGINTSNSQGTKVRGIFYQLLKCKLVIKLYPVCTRWGIHFTQNVKDCKGQSLHAGGQKLLDN